ICNGFQILVRLGILPGWEGLKSASLIENVSAKFEDRWVTLRADGVDSPFLSASETGQVIRMPVAHKEGRFVLRDPAELERLRERGQIAFVYCRSDSNENAEGEYPANPNGSIADIAGITNEAGNVLGLMPHPERFLTRFQDPLWTRRDASELDAADASTGGDGFALFLGAVDSVREARREATSS
ncbi:MAG: phosphoribosylformylglycinamidine synthase subunit PurQ, partial [Planctomycetota bacterium]